MTDDDAVRPHLQSAAAYVRRSLLLARDVAREVFGDEVPPEIVLEIHDRIESDRELREDFDIDEEFDGSQAN